MTYAVLDQKKCCLVTNVLFSLWRHNLLFDHEATVENYLEGNVCEIWSELWRLQLYLLRR